MGAVMGSASSPWSGTGWRLSSSSTYLIMDINESTKHSVAVLALAGRLDATTTDSLAAKVDSLLSGGTHKLVFDCSRLVYASSEGLSVFIAAAQKIKAAGGAASFAALTPQVYEAFDVSKLIGTLEVQPTVSAAVAKLGRH
jgi:anti-anti-sigma factor